MHDRATIAVLLVDDHAVVREGYRRLLEMTGRIRVCAEAADGEEAYRRYAEADRIDVVVMDITLPRISGLEAMRRILARDNRARVLVFSMHEDAVFVSRALDGGAWGYLTKSSAPEVLVEAVLAIAAGRRYLGPDLATARDDATRRMQRDEIARLSEREFEIFRLLAEGNGPQRISELLNLTPKTVANYQSNIRQKLGVENTAQLVHLAIDCGVLDRARDAGGEA
ncbi:response regulator [Derxia gummosa]|uniref:Response regulator n=1 Tax=Derxia gummosa DSM 723 TaxID=1121388 RepID=A0A8B6X1C5_9BURK|nr:response regulator transcription factor [Derxia gummosa]